PGRARRVREIVRLDEQRVGALIVAVAAQVDRLLDQRLGLVVGARDAGRVHQQRRREENCRRAPQSTTGAAFGFSARGPGAPGAGAPGFACGRACGAGCFADPDAAVGPGALSAGGGAFAGAGGAEGGGAAAGAGGGVTAAAGALAAGAGGGG